MPKPKTPRPSLQVMRELGVSRGRLPLLDLPANREAADDLRLYLALCAVGELSLNLLGWTRERLPLFGLSWSNQAVNAWATRRDPACRALLALITAGSTSPIAREWCKRARAEAKKWR